jgi:hypothetical protein
MGLAELPILSFNRVEVFLKSKKNPVCSQMCINVDKNLNCPKNMAGIFHIKLKHIIGNDVWDTWRIKSTLTDSFCWKPSLSNLLNARKITFKGLCKSGFVIDKYC